MCFGGLPSTIGDLIVVLDVSRVATRLERAPGTHWEDVTLPIFVFVIFVLQDGFLPILRTTVNPP